MMKKFLAATFAATILFVPTTFAAPNLPDVPSKISVMDALSQRQTSRNFVDRDLTEAQLTKILWAANGTNRADGKRVVPFANGVYSVEVYAVTREGIFRYDPKSNGLIPIAAGDYRMTTTTGQSFVGKAAVNLVFVENPDAWSTAKKIPPRENQIACANVTVGAMVQNVALAAQTEGLGNCVRGSINRAEFAKIAGIPAENILLAQSVGFTK